MLGVYDLAAKTGSELCARGARVRYFVRYTIINVPWYGTIDATFRGRGIMWRPIFNFNPILTLITGRRVI